MKDIVTWLGCAGAMALIALGATIIIISLVNYLGDPTVPTPW
jgi:hypothetical protein